MYILGVCKVNIYIYILLKYSLKVPFSSFCFNETLQNLMKKEKSSWERVKTNWFGTPEHTYILHYHLFCTKNFHENYFDSDQIFDSDSNSVMHH